jgi:hypothetical protein
MKDWLKKLFGHKYKTYVFYGNVMNEFGIHCSLTVLIDNKVLPDPEYYFKDSVTIWDRKPKAVRYDKALTKQIMYWLTSNFDRINYEREGYIAKDGKGRYLQPYLI